MSCRSSIKTKPGWNEFELPKLAFGELLVLAKLLGFPSYGTKETVIVRLLVNAPLGGPPGLARPVPRARPSVLAEMRSTAKHRRQKLYFRFQLLS